MKEEYVKLRPEALKGFIQLEFLPYMFEYYKHECKKRKFPQLVQSQAAFNQAMNMFLTLPVTVGNNMAEMMMNHRPQTITKGLQKTVKFFDKKYGIK